MASSIERPLVASARPATATLTAVSLLVILGAGIALRFIGLDWDNNAQFHPDERFILMTTSGRISLPFPLPPLEVLLDPKVSPLNPDFFAYGSLPLYLLKFVGHLASQINPLFATADLRLVGRAINAVLDSGTILLTFVIGRRIAGSLAGLIAAALVAFSALHIQLAHFYAVDTMLVFFILLVLFCALRILERPTVGRSLAIGIVFGLALATKVSVAPLALAIGVAFLLSIASAPTGERGDAVELATTGGLFAGAMALLTFLVCEPFALLARETFIANVTEQSEMVRRIRDYPYTRQYIDTPAYWYQISQLAMFGIGLPFGILGWLAVPYAAASAFLRRHRGEAVLLAWVIPYVILTGAFQVKFMRYMLPVVPILAIFTGRLLVDLIQGATTLGRRPRLAAQLLAAGVVAFTALFGLAYVQIYQQPHTGVAMSNWIRANVPAGSLILKEHWEEGLPGLADYRGAELNWYDDDSAAKLRAVSTQLAQADYLVFYSNRLYGTIPRLPERYPMSSAFYERLFAGDLGYELVRAEASYPSIFGVALMDDTFVRPDLPRPAGLDAFLPSPRINLGFADESYSVYDHPLVLLFKKTDPARASSIEAILAPTLPANGVVLPTKAGSGLMQSPELAAANAAGGTWSAIYDEAGIASRLPAVLWLLAIELIGLAALPLTWWICRRLPDRGFLIAKPFGLLLVAWLVWVGASLRVVPFERWSILLALVIVGAVSFVIYRRNAATLRAEFHDRRSMLLVAEGVFLAAFAAFAIIRMLNPDIWHPVRGGEKPMDFAYLNAVVRTTYFPPYDPWFSGGYINYYYFGQVLLATVIKLTGVLPEIAYNLAVPMLFAMTVGGAWSVVYNLARLWPSGDDGAGSEQRAWLAGIVGGLFVGVAGNLDGVAQIADGLRTAGQGSALTTVPIVGPVLTLVAGLLNILQGQAVMPAFDFWRSSRMFPPQISITEFPYFTFLFADLHAHLIALPFAMVVIGFALNVALGAGWPALLAIGLVVGAARPINTWDYPTYLALALVAVLIRQRGQGMVPFTVGAAWRAALIVAVGIVAFAPFLRSYELFYSGVEVSKEQTPIVQYLGVWGMFLFLAVSLLFVDLRARFAGSSTGRLVGISLREWGRLPHVLLLANRLGDGRIGTVLLVGAMIVFAVVVLWVVGLPVPALVLALLVPAGVLIARRSVVADEATPRDLFLWVLFAAAIGIGAFVDIVTLQGDINRMNTVFKFYLQGWLFLAIVASYAFWRLIIVPVASMSIPRTAWTTVATVLVAGTLIYPIAATPVRLRDRFAPLPPTTDGLAYMQATYQDERGPIEMRQDRDAIEWLRDNLAGTPTIVEGVTPLYRWGSRISVNTGLPTVLGWDWHQTQQRTGYAGQVQQRLNDVNQFYTTPDATAAMALAQKYGVRYIIVGSVERLYYPPNGLAKFETMVGRGLDVAYRNDGTIIYRVS